MAFVAVLLVMARSASPEKILWINAQIYAMDASDSQHEAMLSIGGVIRSAGLDLSAPPFGEVSDIATLLSRVEAAASEQEEGRLILGFNYDNTLMESGRHPTREEKHPVWLAHSSGHMGVGNSLALKSFGRVPEGDGLLQESDAPELSSLVFKLLYRKLATCRCFVRGQRCLSGGGCHNCSERSCSSFSRLDAVACTAIECATATGDCMART